MPEEPKLTKRQATSAAAAAKKLLAMLLANLRDRPNTMLWLFAPCALRRHWSMLRLGLDVGDEPVDAVELAGNLAALHAAKLAETQPDPADWIVGSCARTASAGDRRWAEEVSWNCTMPPDPAPELLRDPEALLAYLEKRGHKNLRPPAKTGASLGAAKLALPIELVQTRAVRIEYVERRRLRADAFPCVSVKDVLACSRSGRADALRDIVRNAVRRAAIDAEPGETGAFDSVEPLSSDRELAAPEVVDSNLEEAPDWDALVKQLITMAQAAEKEANI